jgi:hypothetical protein
MLNYGVALALLASRLYVVYAEHAVGKNTQGAQQLIFVPGRPPELGHVCGDKAATAKLSPATPGLRIES